MTVRMFVVSSLAAAIIGWAAWGLIVTYLDPGQAGTLGYVLFFLALFLATSASLSVLGYTLRRLVQPQRLAFYAIRPAVRQGVILGAFLDALLMLQLLRLYRWWVGVIVTIIIVSIELIFLSYDLAHRRPQSD